MDTASKFIDTALRLFGYEVRLGSLTLLPTVEGVRIAAVLGLGLMAFAVCDSSEA